VREKDLGSDNCMGVGWGRKFYPKGGKCRYTTKDSHPVDFAIPPPLAADNLYLVAKDSGVLGLVGGGPFHFVIVQVQGVD